MSIWSGIKDVVSTASPVLLYVVIAMGIALLASFAYIKYERVKNAGQAATIQELLASNKQDEATIADLRKSMKNIQAINNQLSQIQNENNNQALHLAETLTKLDKAALENPKLVQHLINNAVQERLRCLALVTGAKPLKKEKNAVCPQVITQDEGK